MANRKYLEELFHQHGYKDFRWLDSNDILVAHWVRFKCMYGCPAYGKKACCPPNTPGISECCKMFAEYKEVVVFHFQKQLARPEDRGQWSREEYLRLLKLEREIFLAGYYKTLLIPFESCNICDTCAESRLDCKHPLKARAGADALGIDVYATVRKAGYRIEVLKDYQETMDRFAFMMIE